MTQKACWENKWETHFDIIRNIRQRKYELMGIERYIALILYILKPVFPTYRIRHFAKKGWYRVRNRSIEIYLIIKLILLCLLLYYPWQWYATFLAIYILSDVIHYLLWLIFLSNIYTKFPSIRRNFAHLTMNIIEITMSFAVLYLSLGAIGNSNGVITQGSDALYFSFVTFSTIGYGDILPILPIGKTLVIFETLISFLFITIIASSFVSGLEIRNNDTQD